MRSMIKTGIFVLMLAAAPSTAELARFRGGTNA